MADDLIEIRERVQFCRDEIATFSKAVAKWARTAIEYREVPAVFAFLAKPPPEYHLAATQVRPVTTALKSKAGMIANEIRSSLDNLATQLAARNGKTSSGVYFPISKSKEIFDDDGMKKIKKLSPDDQAKIINLSPYRGGNAKLYGLHELDITRKHIRLAATGASGGMTLGDGPSVVVDADSAAAIFNFCDIEGFPVRKLSIYTKDSDFPGLGIETIIARHIPIGLKATPMPALRLDEPDELRGRPVDTALLELCDIVDDIVGRFD